jgi:hypothetical protein
MGNSGAKTLHYKLDGGAEQLVTTSAGNPGTTTLTIAEGRHALEYWAQDEIGATQSPRNNATVVVDKTNPTVTITSDQGRTSYTYGESASVTTKAADENSGLAVDPSGAGQSIPTNKPGRQSVTRTATDRCGHSASATFTYDVGAQLVAAAETQGMKLKVTPRTTPAGESTLFTFTTSTTGGAAAASAHGRAHGSRVLAVSGATITFAGHRIRTNSRGQARVRLTLRRAIRYRARASKVGYRPASASVRAYRVVVPVFTG